MKKLISIVIPCYNEEESLEIIYPVITNVMKTVSEYDYEILLVNDG